MTKWDIPLLNPIRPSNCILSQLWNAEVERAWNRPSIIEETIRIEELRRSCGIEGERSAVVTVRRPSPIREADWSCPECGCKEYTTGPRMGCRRCDWSEPL